MAKPLIIIYAGLRAEMAFKNEDAFSLAELLHINPETARKKLRGESEFSVTQIITLEDHYNQTFEYLFRLSE